GDAASPRPTDDRSSSLVSTTSGLSAAPLSALVASGASFAVSADTCGCGCTFVPGSRGCEKLTGEISPGVTSTRAPIRVQFHILIANASGMRMQPCEAG